MNRFKTNDRVKVISETCKTFNYFGVVKDYDYDRWRIDKYVAVLLDGYDHIITYREDSLKLIEHDYKIKNQTEKGDNIMFGDFKVAGVKFCDGSNQNTVYYYALYNNEICVGDKVVVMTGHHGMGVATVTEIDDVNSNKVQYGREVVCKIDMTDFNNRKEKKIRMKELKNKMDAQVKKLQESAVYEMLADKDDELKSMLQEYKLLKNSNANDMVF